MRKHTPPASPSWLEEAYPQVHYLLLSLTGDIPASRWLAENSRGISLFCRALVGEKEALASFENRHKVALDDLFEVIDNEDLTRWLEERRPELHLLFEAIQGDDQALQQLERNKVPHARLVKPLRRIHMDFLERTSNAEDMLQEGTAADMGCLIGEMHLRQGEYEKAIEAFTRAIETQPAADLYEGRARAFRHLADRDEAAARLLRQG